MLKKLLIILMNENGGFKGAPKFPQFYIFDTILHFYQKQKIKNI